MKKEFIDNFPTLFRGWLYFMAIFLASISDEIGPVLKTGAWPSGPAFASACLVGGCAALIGIRAFYDGSAQRRSDYRKAQEQNGNGKTNETKSNPIS